MGEKLLAPPCQGILITLPQCQFSDDRALSWFYCQKSCLKVPLLSFVGFPVLLVLHDYFHTCEMSGKLEPSAVQGELFATVENGADEMPETPCLYSSFPPHLHYYVTHCHCGKGLAWPQRSSSCLSYMQTQPAASVITSLPESLLLTKMSQL